ncbi:uncharacterized protein LOC111436237 [Cucurbita moschata]|uniref:Uncharacterized protein LOC111436237 n=1 Tax=Cucurbita moschata TaxID=3662 RepID=A0A6J1EV61_CUCMO|nr:uncharacterized protein LOC111436237 [Cucurbita moschata]
MSGKQLDQWGNGYQSYDDDLDDYSYSPPLQGNVQVARIGYVGVVSAEVKQVSSYEQSWRTHDRNRQTGSYTTASTKEVASRGETFKERSSGRVGSKDEFKTTSTYRVGDRSGYTEYQRQERFRRVDFGSGGSSSNSIRVEFGSWNLGLWCPFCADLRFDMLFSAVENKMEERGFCCFLVFVML